MNPRAALFVPLLLTLLGTAAGALGAQPQDPTLNVLLIGWDGVSRHRVKEGLEKSQLPNLKKIVDKGSIVAIDILRVTSTKPGWTQILTGYEPEKTGVYANHLYQPIPAGYTLFERLKGRFGPAIDTLVVSGKDAHLDYDPPVRLTPAEEANYDVEKWYGSQPVEIDGNKFVDIPGKPFLHARPSVDVWLNRFKSNSAVADQAIELLKQHREKPFFMFVLFADADARGHDKGEDSKEYGDAIVSDDTETGRILRALQNLKIDRKTVIYITSDHGFNIGMKHHSDAPYSFLASTDPAIQRRGERADIAPTIYQKYGFLKDEFDPPLDGHSLTDPYVQSPW
ncbi:MAG TPA: alkaline phosphatase family protein [Elusimicrobiota bacterium]|nr:alkaline phosphatase family protein [Elusimicrobiota bacterium]